MCIGGGGGRRIFVTEIGGRNFIEADFLKSWDPIPKKMTAPLRVLWCDVSDCCVLPTEYPTPKDNPIC